MRQAGTDELLFEISETEDDDINRKSTPCDSYLPINPRPPAPHPDSIPTIDPESRRLAEELFSKQFPESFQRLKSTPGSSRGEGSSYSRSAEHSPVQYPNVPRVHVALETRTCTRLFLPFHFGIDSSLDLPSHDKTLDSQYRSGDSSFAERSMREAEARRDKRRKAWTEKLKQEMQECTFRPKVIGSPKGKSQGDVTQKDMSLKRTNSSYSSRYLKQKSTSNHSHSPMLSRSPTSTQGFAISDRLRVPPPNPLNSFPPTKPSPPRKGSYSPLSPTPLTTSYKEGCDWRKLRLRIAHRR